jgi:hypothetical protein
MPFLSIFVSLVTILLLLVVIRGLGVGLKRNVELKYEASHYNENGVPDCCPEHRNEWLARP